MHVSHVTALLVEVDGTNFAAYIASSYAQSIVIFESGVVRKLYNETPCLIVICIRCVSGFIKPMSSYYYMLRQSFIYLKLRNLYHERSVNPRTIGLRN